MVVRYAGQQKFWPLSWPPVPAPPVDRPNPCERDDVWIRASPVDACADLGRALGFSSCRILAVAFGGGAALVVAFGITISGLATAGGAGDGFVSGSAFWVVAPAIWVTPPLFAPTAPPRL